MIKNLTYVLLCFLAMNMNLQAQGGFSHEIGLIAGPVAFQSDYGERKDFKTNMGNTGLGFGIIHYLNFSYRADCNCYTPETYFNDHIKLRTELSYNKTTLNMFGKWVTPEKLERSEAARKLKAMEGSVSVTDIGMQLEYYPLSIRDFTSSTGNFGPFVSLGAHYSFFSPKFSTALGKANEFNIPTKYWEPSDGKKHGFSNDTGSTFSIVSSLGTRYKLNPLGDLILDFRIQYYFSNWVDGLNPNPEKYKENKANDWNVWLNFGYIYYLN